MSKWIIKKNKKGIYYPLYDSSNLNYLKEKLYPGNDTKPNKVYFDIINHFKSKPDVFTIGLYKLLFNLLREKIEFVDIELKGVFLLIVFELFWIKEFFWFIIYSKKH